MDRSRADDGRAGALVQARRSLVGQPRGIGDDGLAQLLEADVAHIGQVAPLGPPRGSLVVVHGDRELARDAPAERVGEPGGYARLQLEVEPAGDPAAGAPSPGAAVQAWAYMQSAARLAGDAVHIGPIAEYTMEHARTLAW